MGPESTGRLIFVAILIFGSIAVGTVLHELGSLVVQFVKSVRHIRVNLGDRYVDIRPGMTGEEFDREVAEALRE